RGREVTSSIPRPAAGAKPNRSGCQPIFLRIHRILHFTPPFFVQSGKGMRAMSLDFVAPSILSRVPDTARSVLVIGFERNPATEALAARPGTDVVCIEWYDNAIADARTLFRNVIAMPFGEESLALCSHPFDCIAVSHLKGITLSLPQALELLAPW